MGVRSKGFRRELRGGKPHLIVDFRYVDKTGRVRRFRRDAAVQTATAARAEAERLMALAAATGEVTTTRSMPTFAAFVAAEFRTVHMATRCRPATRERYDALFRQGILGAFGSKRLDDIGAVDIRRYMTALAARGVQARGPVSLVRTVLRVAHEYGVLEKLPELPKLPPQSRKLPDAPTVEEIRAMLLHAKGWLRLALALAAYAGLRMGEVRALEVRDVDLEHDRLLVRRALSAGSVLPPKSGHAGGGPRAPELTARRGAAGRGKLPRAGGVLTGRGKTPGRQHVLAVLSALQARHGLRARSFHSLRHAFCSVLIRRGASLEAVRLLAGHSDIRITQRYVHAAAGDLEAAIAKLGN